MSDFSPATDDERDLAVELCMVAARWLKAHPNTELRNHMRMDLGPLRAWVHQEYREHDHMQDVCDCDETLRGSFYYEHFWRKTISFAPFEPSFAPDDDDDEEDDDLNCA